MIMINNIFNSVALQSSFESKMCFGIPLCITLTSACGSAGMANPVAAEVAAAAAACILLADFFSKVGHKEKLPSLSESRMPSRDLGILEGGTRARAHA